MVTIRAAVESADGPAKRQRVVMESVWICAWTVPLIGALLLVFTNMVTEHPFVKVSASPPPYPMP